MKSMFFVYLFIAIYFYTLRIFVWSRDISVQWRSVSHNTRGSQLYADKIYWKVTYDTTCILRVFVCVCACACVYVRECLHTYVCVRLYMGGREVIHTYFYFVSSCARELSLCVHIHVCTYVFVSAIVRKAINGYNNRRCHM